MIIVILSSCIHHSGKEKEISLLAVSLKDLRNTTELYTKEKAGLWNEKRESIEMVLENYSTYLLKHSKKVNIEYHDQTGKVQLYNVDVGYTVDKD